MRTGLLLCVLLACSVFTAGAAQCNFPFSSTGSCTASDSDITERSWSVTFDEDSDFPASLVTYLTVSADSDWHFSYDLGDNYELDQDTSGDDFDITVYVPSPDDSGASKASTLLVFLVCALCLSFGVSTTNKRSSLLLLAFLVILPLASLQDSETLTVTVSVPASVLDGTFSVTFYPETLVINKDASILPYLAHTNCIQGGCVVEATFLCALGQYKVNGVCTGCTGGTGYACGSGFIRSGTACTGTSATNAQTCTACSKNGAAYTCAASGERRNGTLCVGTSNTDTQTCTACANGGAAYACAASGEFKNGSACTSTSTTDTQTCSTCGNGGAAYACAASGQYRSGSACTSSSIADTQTCASCTGGASYDCGAGFRRTGTACDSSSLSDTQTCTPCLNSNNGNTLPYSCGAGFYKTGTDCTGNVTTDTQSCAPCTGGAAYTCAAGESQSGTACDGLGFSNTQTCVVNGCSGNPSLCSATQHCTNNICVGSGWLYFSLSWTTPGDGDLYVTTPGGQTIEYTNKGPNAGTGWGKLDRDDTTGTGPENVYWPTTGPYPASGVYHACLDNYSTTFVIPQNVTYYLNSSTALTKVATNTHTTPGLPSPCTVGHPNYLGNVTVVGLNCTTVRGAGCNLCNPTKCFACDAGYVLNAQSTGCVALPACGAGYCAVDQRCVNGACIGVGIVFFSIQWQNPSDVDLYLTTPNGNTISYTNRGPDAGTDWGFLDRDDTTGTGPENVYWQGQYASPPAGTYLLCVDNFGGTAITPQNVYYQLNNGTNLTHVLVDTHTTPGLPDPCTVGHPNYLGSFTYAGLNCVALFGAGCNSCNSTQCFGCATGYGLDTYYNTCVSLLSCPGVTLGSTGASLAADFCDPYYRCINGACIGSGYLFFTIQWSQPGDGDIYLTTPLGNTISYTNTAADGGFQDRDDTSGTGPENIYWPRYNRAPPAGVYNLCIDNYNSGFVIPQTVYWQAGIGGSNTTITNHTYNFVTDSHSAPGVPNPCTPGHPNYLGSVNYTGFDCSPLGITGCSACNDTVCFECDPGYNFVSGSCVDICSLCARNQRCVNYVCVGAGLFYFTIQWQYAGDLDIVLTIPDGSTIYYAASSAGGGSLDRDDTTGTGPENIFWNSTAPAAGTYLLCAYTQSSINFPNNVYYNLNSPTTQTKALNPSTGVSASTACSAGHPNYLGSITI